MKKLINILILFLLTIEILYPNGNIVKKKAAWINSGHVLGCSYNIKLIDGTWMTVPKRYVIYYGEEEHDYFMSDEEREWYHNQLKGDE